MIKIADKLFLLVIILWIQMITGLVVQNRRNVLNAGVRKVVSRNVLNTGVRKVVSRNVLNTGVRKVVSRNVLNTGVRKVVSRNALNTGVRKVVSRNVIGQAVGKNAFGKVVRKNLIGKVVRTNLIGKVVSKNLTGKVSNDVAKKVVVSKPIVNKVVASNKAVVSKTIFRKAVKKMPAFQQPKSRYFSAPKSRTIQTILKREQLQKNENTNLVRAINMSSGSGLNSSEITSSNMTEAESQSQEDVKHLWNPSFSLPTKGRFENGSLCLEEISECWGDSMCPWFEICKRINCVRTCVLRGTSEWDGVMVKAKDSRSTLDLIE